MAHEADIAWHGQPHGQRDIRFVFTVAGDTVAGIEYGYSVGIGGIGEFPFGMGIAHSIKFFQVTVFAGFLHQLLAAEGTGMTILTGEFYLVMAA
jgi:hypothetical protein